MFSRLVRLGGKPEAEAPAVEIQQRAAPAPPAGSIETEELENRPGLPEDPEPGSLEHQVIQAISTVYDPEIPVNIFELGLIYGVGVDEGKNVTVVMTLTTPNCPAAQSLPAEVQTKVSEIPEVSSAKIHLTFDPPWEMSKMSEAAKLELGFF